MIANAQWWNSSFAYRTPINISVTTGNKTSPQLNITINTNTLWSQGKVNANCSDVRFTWLNSTSGLEQNISYWNETACNTTATKYWVNPPLLINASNLNNNTVYMYYGNPSAAVIAWTPAYNASTYSSAGITTWVAPAGITNIVVETWGAGGGGGAGSAFSYGGGGGGGAYSKNSSMPVTIGASYSVGVGNFGTGGSSGKGNSGGQSNFTSGATRYVNASGGSYGSYDAGYTGGAGGAGGATAAGTGNVKYKGGDGDVGDDSVFYGGGGGGGGSTGNGGGASTFNGGSGTVNGGGNGGGVGGAAQAAGGGGVGGNIDNNGGNGAVGKVNLTYINSTNATLTFLSEEAVPIANTAPTWSLNRTSIANNSAYNPSTNYGFQVNWTDDNDNNGYNFSYFEYNNANYTATRSGNISYYNITSLGAGAISWRFYANDSSNNWNKTDQWGYTVVQNTTNPVNIFLINSTGTYQNQNMSVAYDDDSFEANATIIYANSGTANLYMDGTASSNPSSSCPTIGLHNFTGNVTGNTNYTSNSTGATYWVNVLDVTPPTYTSNGTNNTNPNPLDQVLYYANWTDNVALSHWIFSWNATGALCDEGFANDTAVAFGAGTWSNVTKQAPLACAGKTIDFLFYANDTSNNWNKTVDMFENETLNIPISDCSVLNQAGATYVMTGDIIDSSNEICMDIQADNVTFDCQGHTIDGDGISGGVAVNIWQDTISLDNITVKNCISTDYLLEYYGAIYIGDSSGITSNVTITNDTFRNNWCDISLDYANAGERDYLIYNNLFNDSNYIYFAQGSEIAHWNTTNQSGTNIFDNRGFIGGNYWTNSTGNGYSDKCSDADGNGYCDIPYSLATDNIDYLPLSNAYENPRPCYEIGSCSILDIVGETYCLTEDIINEESPVCMNIIANNITFDCQGHTIDGGNGEDTGIQIYRDAEENTDIIVRDCILRDWVTYGINIGASSNNTLLNNTVSNSYYGIFFGSNSDNDIINNTIDNSSENGIRFAESSNNTLSNNSIRDSKSGIYFENSFNNTIHDTILENNTNGIYFWEDSAEGYRDVDNSFYNNLINNSINLYCYDENIIGECTNIGENFWNTTQQSGARIYSDGIDIGGNYWTNETGNGYSDTCTDSDCDGFCDSPLTLATNNLDYLPYSDKYIEGGCVSNDATWYWGFPNEFSLSQVTGASEESATDTIDWLACNFTEREQNWVQPFLNGASSVNQSISDNRPFFYIDNAGTGSENFAIRLNDSMPAGINITANASCSGTYDSCQTTPQLLTTSYTTLVSGLSQTDSFANITFFCGVNKSASAGTHGGLSLIINGSLSG